MFYPVRHDQIISIAESFDGLFSQFLTDERPARTRAAQWSPRFELLEFEDAFQIEAELPGLNKDQVDIVVEEEFLTIRGMKKSAERSETSRRIFSDRSYGSFERRFRLAGDVCKDAIDATYENGVLVLKLPKQEAMKPTPQQIKIH